MNLKQLKAIIKQEVSQAILESKASRRKLNEAGGQKTLVASLPNYAVEIYVLGSSNVQGTVQYVVVDKGSERYSPVKDYPVSFETSGEKVSAAQVRKYLPKELTGSMMKLTRIGLEIADHIAKTIDSTVAGVKDSKGKTIKEGDVILIPAGSQEKSNYWDGFADDPYTKSYGPSDPYPYEPSKSQTRSITRRQTTGGILLLVTRNAQGALVASKMNVGPTYYKGIHSALKNLLDGKSIAYLQRLGKGYKDMEIADLANWQVIGNINNESEASIVRRAEVKYKLK